MKSRLSRWVCLLLIPCLIGVGFAVSAQVAEHSHRLKKLYDFEDTDDRGNKIGFSGKLMPRNWYIVGRSAIGEDEKFHHIPLHKSLESREGYPRFSEVGFDRSHAVSGDFSLRLAINGGQTGAYVQQGAINVKPQSDYRVTAKVFTQKLDHAWAEMRAYFIDQNGRRIEQSVQHSQPITTKGKWQTVSIKMIGDFDGAAYIGIELHIVQPKMDSDSPIGQHQVVPGDIDGGAWFDDVSVWELPSVSISTGVRTNILTGKDPPKLQARVRDLTGRRMRAVISVYNHRYELIDQLEDDIDKEGWSWTPDLGGQYGWYWADLQIFEVDASSKPTTQVARTLAGFQWLPQTERVGGDDRSRFVLVAEDVPNAHLPLISEILNQTKINSLVVSGWERNATPQSTVERVQLIEPIVRELIVRRGEVAVSFWPVPVELAARVGIDATDPLNLLTKPSEKWMDYAKPFLAPLGQRLENWQVGSSQHPQAFLARDLAADLKAARHGIRSAAPSPDLIAPWRLDQSNRAEALSGTDSYAVAWPQGVTPDQLAGAMADWPVPPANVRLDIELADAIDMTHERRIADLMLRVLHAWELQVGSIGLAKPWTEAHERHTSLTPDPVLGAWVNLTRELEGQRVLGRMPLAPGLHAMILDGKQGGMLAVWNENSDEEFIEMHLLLGDSPVVVDAYGNRKALKTTAGKQTFRVGKTPTLIRGIDPRLAMLRSRFQVDEPFVESLQVAHRRTVKIYNPWPRTMNGHFTFIGPEGWQLQPQRKHISIAPGDTAEVPISLRFPIHENGGQKTLSAQFVFNVGTDIQATLHTPIELGLRGVQFDATTIVQPGKTQGTVDAIVTLTVTNTSDAKQSLNIFAGLQGHARRELILPGVAPGEFVSRQIRFKNVGDQVGKSPLRCGVRESNGPAVLNQSIELVAPREADGDPPEIAEVPTS